MFKARWSAAGLIGEALLLASLALWGCKPQNATPPTNEVNFSGSNIAGPVNIVTTNGSSSPGGTAPCAALGAPQKGNGQQAPACDNSTNTANPPAEIPPGTTTIVRLPPQQVQP